MIFIQLPIQLEAALRRFTILFTILFTISLNKPINKPINKLKYKPIKIATFPQTHNVEHKKSQIVIGNEFTGNYVISRDFVNDECHPKYCFYVHNLNLIRS